MSISKERRQELREVADEAGHGPVGLDTFNDPDPNLSGDELRALLDLADERDRYRSLLREVRTLLAESASWTEIKDTQAEIDAALEGKNND